MPPEHRITAIAAALRAAEEGGLAHRAPADVLSGYSGERLLGALQRLVALYPSAEAVYLEVGVFQGLSLLSVAGANPATTCLGVDNFSQFDPRGENRALVERRRAALGIGNARLIDRDYEDAFSELPAALAGRRIGVYFVDGPHDYRSQRVCLDLAVPHLHPGAVILVDDANYPHVRLANRDFLVARPDFKLLFEAYTPRHPLNMDAADERAARAGWWNGVNVILHDPDGRLAPMFPETPRDRTLYVNDHVVHSSRLAARVPDLLDAVEPLLGRTAAPRDVGRALRGLMRLVRGPAAPHRTANTGSEALPASRFHPGI